MNDSTVDWQGIAATDTAGAAAPAAAAQPLPDLPLVVGRLPIKGDTAKAIIQLPEATKDVKCAFTVANTSVLSDCGNEASASCYPNVLRSRPLNDREIEVILDGNGDGKVVGPGWTSGPYGGQLTTRSIDFGTPFVEVLVVAGRGIPCGCDSDKWADDSYGG